MKTQWHRDRIDELKHKVSNLLWELTALLTGFLGLMYIIYLVWYNQDEILIRGFLVFLFIFFFYKFGKKIRSFTHDISKLNEKITSNYDILLNREK